MHTGHCSSEPSAESKNPRTWRSFRHDEIHRAFQTQGYEVRFRTGQFFFPMALHRWWNLRNATGG